MTAEIAILNKTAVALATDSAVTVSSGITRHKMFDSGDKLFELCDHNPIGIMVNNTMDFVGIPLGSLVRKFRSDCSKFGSVNDAGAAFLNFLSEEGKRAPALIQNEYVLEAIQILTDTLVERSTTELRRYFEAFLAGEGDSDEAPRDHYLRVHRSTWEHQIEVLKRGINAVGPGSFVGRDDVPPLTDDLVAELSSSIRTTEVPDEYAETVCREIVYPYLISDRLTSGHTGIIITGFGSTELFPTLVSYRIEGMVFGFLKFVPGETIDIDRVGRRAAVLPFAQREMVDRFIYGFDDPIQRDIASFCEANLTEFRDTVETMIEFEDENDKTVFQGNWQRRQDEFLKSLKADAFETVRSKTQESVEVMVEFMPKPELARMAEALIEVTSLKRRVTEGMETVAGPIDVAVISQSEGFVWVKRKHYFPSDLNPRHAARVAAKGSGTVSVGAEDAG